MPIVPPEIIEAIVSQVAFEDLRACALASKLLLPFARQKLYRSIQISFLVWYPERQNDYEHLDGKIVQPQSQVVLLATLQRCPHLGSLVREIESANEDEENDNFMDRATENTFKDFLRACPNVESITYPQGSSRDEAGAVVRAVLAIKPPLRGFTLLPLESNLAQEFLLAYPQIESLGVIATLWRLGETSYPPAAFWPAELTTLKLVVVTSSAAEAITRVFEAISTNSCHSLTSLHLSYKGRGPPPDDPPDLSRLTALRTLTLEGLKKAQVKPILSSCNNLQRLLYQLEINPSDPSMSGFLDAVPSTVLFLGLRSCNRYRVPLEGVTKCIEAGTSPLLREIWIAFILSDPWEAQDGGAEMVAACDAMGIVVRRKDWGRDEWSGR